MNPLLIGLMTALGRNFGGWLKNSVADGKIQAVETKLLVISTISTALVFLVSFFGLAQFDGLNEEVLSVISTMLFGPVLDKLFAKFWK